MTWTADEREQIHVWADALQSRGDRFGEVVMLLQTARALVERGELVRAADLRARALAIAAGLPITTLIQDLAKLEPRAVMTWRDGLLVGLRFGGWFKAKDWLTKRIIRVLSDECARFLQILEVDVDGVSEDAIPGLLADPEILARPRTIVIGRHPGVYERHYGRAITRWHGTWPPEGLEAGLRTLFIHGHPYRLSLGKRKVKRHRVIRAAGRRLLDPTRPIDPRDLTLVARGLWDPGPNVYRAALETIIALGPRAAPLLPDTLLSFSCVTPDREPVAEEFAEAFTDHAALAEALVPHLLTSALVTTWVDGPKQPWGTPQGYVTMPEVARSDPAWGPVCHAVARFAERNGLYCELPDLNSADATKLMRIEGLGTVRVGKIIQARPLASVDELVGRLRLPARVAARVGERAVVRVSGGEQGDFSVGWPGGWS